MTRIRFQGFEDGVNTSLSATRGGITKGPVTISSWRQPGGPSWSGDALSETLTIEVDEILPALDTPAQSMAFAPLGVEWRIKVTGSSVGAPPDDITNETQFAAFDPTFQGIQYVVHTGDSGTYRNTRLAHASHGSKAVQYGQNPGHVYSDPGTYTGRSIYVYDANGQWGVLDLPDLDVTDPDAVIVPTQTIVVSNDPGETWADAPPHVSGNRVTTIDAAFALFSVFKETLDRSVRISVKSGTTYAEVARELSVTYTQGRILIDSWGGSEPWHYTERNSGIRSEGALLSVGGSDSYCWPWTLSNCTFDFGYDVTSGMPSNGWANANLRSLTDIGDDRNFSAHSEVTGLRLVYDRVDVTGCAYAVTGIANSQYVSRNSAWFFNDCIFQDNNDYVLFQASNLFFMGCQGLETYGSELGLMGRGRVGGTQRGFRGHRNVRETTTWMFYIRACFWESKGGWSGQNNGSTGYSAQPLFRIHEASNSAIKRIGKRMFFCDSVFMGPFNMDLPASANRAGMHSVVENSLLVYDPMTVNGAALTGLAGRKTVRNNMFICMDTPYLETTSAPELSGRDMSKFETPNNRVNMGPFRRFIQLDYQENGETLPCENLHNTFVMLRADADVDGSYEVRNRFYDYGYDDPDQGLQDMEALYDMVEGHNVNHAPNLASPVGQPTGKTAVPAGVRSLDLWMKTCWERQAFTLPAPVGPGATTPEIPYPNDWYGNATTQASYAGGENHSLRITATRETYSEIVQLDFHNGTPGNTDAITVNFGITGFTVTNRSSGTWSGDITMILHRGSTSMAPDRVYAVDNAEIGLYRPVTPQALDAGVPSTLFDFGRNLRPSAGFAISPAGTNEAGALLATS